jgi:D-alanyl-D-alanine carboxypeptidase/D-alanyl-D-alanine-endopeptidase (penicillin-binding protein 4)
MLNRIVSAMNRESINLYAELLLRNASRGRNRSTQGTISLANHTVRRFFSTLGADTTAIYHADGSGLSINNRITARSMIKLLNYAHTAPWGPAFHASLPVAGESETLKKRMKGSPAQANLHAKTGTTNDVVSLAGYVTALNGELLSFVLIYNGTDRWIAKESIDVIGETLANFAR